jgi:DNA-binding NtrC family response regulator
MSDARLLCSAGMARPRDETATRIHKRAGKLVASVRRIRLTTGGRGHELAATAIRVGTHPANDLVIDDAAVSRIHFEILADAHGFRMRDLGSTNGTFVDGCRANDIYLRPRARIELGDTEIIFEPLADEVELEVGAADHFGPLLGKSAAMRRMFGVLESVAPTDATVLIEGESGTGKELVAEAIHTASARGVQPLVVFDCAAVARNLIEAELFGNEKGAFTGADSARAGRLEEADGGTLFLDEIGELPLDLQPKLLRALERREVRRVGGSKTHKIDVRIVAATNRDLAREVNAKTFREDLYYRLAVVRVVVPPLRERLDDLPLLVDGLLRRAWRTPSEVPSIVACFGEATWKGLRAHLWPGNVRELRNAVDRAIALAHGKPPTEILANAPTPPAAMPASSDPFAVDLERPFLDQKAELVARFEADYLRRLLAAHGNNATRAASIAGIDRTYLKRLIAKHGL